MGSIMSKSSSNTATSSNNARSEQESNFSQFTNSIRRSLRIKRRSVGSSDSSKPQNQSPPAEQPKTQSRVRSGLPEDFYKQSNPTPTATTPKSPVDTKIAASKAPETASPIPAKAEQSKLTSPTTKDGKDAESKTEINEAMDLLKGAIATGVKQEKDTKEDEKTEDVQHVEDILSKLAPADDDNVKTPETKPETTANPAASLLASLELRKAKVAEEKQKEEESDSEEESNNDKPKLSSGVANVLESIATGSHAVKSKEAASLMASFVQPSSDLPEAKEGVEKTDDKEADSVEKS